MGRARKRSKKNDTAQSKDETERGKPGSKDPVEKSLKIPMKPPKRGKKKSKGRGQDVDSAEEIVGPNSNAKETDAGNLKMSTTSDISSQQSNLKIDGSPEISSAKSIESTTKPSAFEMYKTKDSPMPDDTSSSDFDDIEGEIDSRNITDVDDVVEESKDMNTSQEVDDEGAWREQNESLRRRIFRLTREKNTVAVILEPAEHLVFLGKASIRVLSGSVNILGYHIKPTGQYYPVYSPDCNSALVINADKSDPSTDDAMCDDIIKKNPKLQSALSERTNSYVLILLQSLNCDSAKLISSTYNTMYKVDQYKEIALCFNELGFALTCKRSGIKQISLPEDMNEVTRKFKESSKKGADISSLALFGGKNVGKSTIGRYLTNVMLGSMPEVVFMECDVGQTEFTTPGFVSLSVVRTPSLGPPSSHQIWPDFSLFYGALTPAEDPGSYVECIRAVYSHYDRHYRHLPLIVNTLGWNTGVGLHLAVDFLNIVQPAFIIQIDSQMARSNFPPLTPEFVSTTPGWSMIKETPADLSHTVSSSLHFAIQSSVEPYAKAQKYSALDHRTMSVLSYYSQTPGLSGDNLLSIKPYRVRWDDVAVHVAHAAVVRSQILCVLNASIVALCHVPEEQMETSNDYGLKLAKPGSSFQAFGTGIIRSIDPEERVFYIITPAPVSMLKRINCLVQGTMSIPQQIILGQKCSSRSIPYTDNPKDTLGVTNIKPRRHMLRAK